MKGGIELQKKKFEQYTLKNEEFIIVHAGISRYRCLRVYLIGCTEAENMFVYDIVIPKMPKKVPSKKKQNEVIEPYPNNLTAEERMEKAQKQGIGIDFLNYPFFYLEVIDLLLDLNFKNYTLTHFNTAFLPNGNVLKTFAQITDEVEEIFVATITNPNEAVMVQKLIKKVDFDKKTPNVFYCFYRNILENSSVSLQLTNFIASPDFICNNNHEDEKISPIKTIKDQDSKKLHANIEYAQHLNKLPLRKSKATQSVSVLPSLPQRFIIDKQQFKIPSLRYVFHDAYKFPVVALQKACEKEELLPEKNGVFITNNNDKPSENREYLSEEQKIRPRLIKAINILTKTPNKDLTTHKPIKIAHKVQKSFQLEGKVVEAIKTNYLSYMSPSNLNNSEKHKLKPLFKSKLEQIRITEILKKIFNKYKEFPCIQSILKTYNCSIEWVHGIVKQHLLLHKKMEQYKSQTLDIAHINYYLSREEILEGLENSAYLDKKVNIGFIKNFYSQFKRMNSQVFKRILQALEIIQDDAKDKEISLEQHCTLVYYFVDLSASQMEYIEFGKKFFDPQNKKESKMEDIYNLLKLISNKEEVDTGNNETFNIKGIVSNYILCGVIDTQGLFDPKAFQLAYEKKKINIMSLIRIIIS